MNERDEMQGGRALVSQVDDVDVRQRLRVDGELLTRPVAELHETARVEVHEADAERALTDCAT
jgi:hypothetical protein